MPSLLQTLRTQPFAELKQWCQEHVSSDIEFIGADDKQHKQYLALAQDYLEVFPTQSNQLAYAALHGYDHYIQQLPADASVFNQLNEYGLSPLHLAAVNGHINTAKALLQHGALPTCQNAQQQYPLSTCLKLPFFCSASLRANKVQLFRLLNDAAPGLLEHQDNSGHTVFHRLAEKNWSELLAEVIPQAPNGLLIKNNTGNYPVHCALLNRANQVLELLLNTPKLNQLTDPHGWNALHYAARDDKLSCLAQSCRVSPQSINTPVREGKTPLTLAYEAKNQAAIDTLLNAGADEHHTTKNNKV